MKESYSICTLVSGLLHLALSSRFICVVAHVRFPFLWKIVQYSILSLYHILVISLFFDVYLGCFHLLAVLNNAAMSVVVQISVQDPAFSYFGFIARSGIAGSDGNSMLKFLRNHPAVFNSNCTILHAHQQHQAFPLFHILTNTWYFPFVCF